MLPLVIIAYLIKLTGFVEKRIFWAVDIVKLKKLLMIFDEKRQVQIM